MKRNYIFVILAFFVIGIGIIIGIVVSNKTSNYNQNAGNRITQEENTLDNEINIVTTSSKDEKTTPNTLLIFKTYYKECGHTMQYIEDIEEGLVNETKEEIQSKFPDWNIEEFGKQQIIFYKENEGICNEHYILKDCNGYVYIYLSDEKGEEKLNQITEIVTEYLPETDRRALKEGIKVVGKEKLNATLEDYE